jgi:hypothetical protein
VDGAAPIGSGEEDARGPRVWRARGLGEGRGEWKEWLAAGRVETKRRF